MATISYQKSHGDPLATSNTGVCGLVMLACPTADSLRIVDSINAKQIVRGCAFYLKRMTHRLPDSISENEKIYFSVSVL
ncbi:MAG: hypothetical protein ACTXOO_05060 [Sodalis sp. (in: enterobacteria)]